MDLLPCKNSRNFAKRITLRGTKQGIRIFWTRESAQISESQTLCRLCDGKSHLNW